MADADRLFALDQRCFAPGIAYSLAEIRGFLRARDRGFHVGCEMNLDGRGLARGPREPRASARPAKVMAGFILSLRRRDRGHVITIDVEESFRRQGIARALMQAVENYYAAQGARGMRLEAAEDNHAALRFYDRLGYRIVRALPDYYAPGQHGLLLAKDWGEETRSNKQ